jgi:hypothetical protein
MEICDEAILGHLHRPLHARNMKVKLALRRDTVRHGRQKIRKMRQKKAPTKRKAQIFQNAEIAERFKPQLLDLVKESEEIH